MPAQQTGTPAMLSHLSSGVQDLARAGAFYDRCAAVDAFHAAAMAAGGRDEGRPGLRPHYGVAYYAAFVVDLDGHKLEAVHQGGAESA